MERKLYSPSVSKTRQRLAQVLRASPELIRVDDAVRVLGVSRADAAKQLARWHTQGRLRRVRRGIYTPVPDYAADLAQVINDPWVLVPGMFDPAYIGGWSAAEQWDLTEQIFRSILVVTTKHVKHRDQTVSGIKFQVRQFRETAFFGTKTIWRGQTRVLVSDIHKTIVDMFHEPSMGGGIQHVAHCFRDYLQGGQSDFETLLEYAERMDNGGLFKRLGLLAEVCGAPEQLMEGCRLNLTAGLAKLDSTLPNDRIISRWRLRVPRAWEHLLQND